MQAFSNPVVPTVITIAVLLGAAEAIRRGIPGFSRLGLPSCILAGILGLALGPEVAGWLPLDVKTLETAVYHGLAVVFIALSLQAPKGEGLSPSAKAMGVAVPTMIAIQTLVGLGLVVGLGLLQGETLHPGFGLILPYGFEQGPGQALAIGTAWEASGMTNGSAVGLIVAAMGFGWAIVGGIPLIAMSGGTTTGADAASEQTVQAPPPTPLGAPDRFMVQIAAIAVVYALTWGVCVGLSRLLAGAPEIAAIVWGFHFLFGALIAIPMRMLLQRITPDLLDDALLGRIAGTTVDATTTAAIAAIQLAVLSANWLPIVVVTTGGGLVTLGAVILLARWGFKDAPREHLLVWFGMSTGTLPMGLALLRAVDPELRSPAPASAVAGSAMALPLAAPIVLLIHPMAITEGAGLTGSLTVLGLTALYLVLLLLGWRWLAKA